MSKFNKQSTGKLITRPELKRQSGIPLSEYHKIQSTIQSQTPPEKQHLKDTVKKIIEQIRENKNKSSVSNGEKRFKDVVHELMKHKSRAYNENVLKLAKSVVLQSRENPPPISQEPTPTMTNTEDILQTYENTISDKFNGENEMTLGMTTKQPPKIRFGNATEHNQILKHILNH